MKQREISLGPIFLGFGGLILLWQILSVTANSPAIPSPVKVLIFLGMSLSGKEIWLHMLASFLRLVVSIFLALLVGTGIGGASALNEKLDKLLSPVLYVLFPVPKVALLPILFVFLGLGEITRITLIFLIVVFQIAVAIRDGIKNIPSELFLTAKLLHLTKGQLYQHVLLPAVAKPIFSALRVSIGIGTAVLFFAENYSTNYGLGYYIMNCWSLIDYVGMYSGILLLSGLGAALFGFLDFLEARLCPWKG